MVLFEDDSIVIIDKPSGYTTHRSNESMAGIQELVSGLAHQTLTAAHRLDRDTSGLLVLCKSAEALATWQKRFENREVRKTYAFLSRNEFKGPGSRIESVIEPDSQRKGSWTSSQGKNPANAITIHLSCTSAGSHFLHLVQPLTGRTHQVRLHAADWNCKILGDTLYNESDTFPRLALHSYRLEWSSKGKDFRFEAPLPDSFVDSNSIGFPVEWQVAIERRKRINASAGLSNVRRWRHKTDFSSRSSSQCTIDQINDVVVVSDFAESDRSVDTDKLKKLAHHLGSSHWIYRRMFERGTDPSARQWICSNDAPLRWTGIENEITYEFRRDSGASTGLFLDQKPNRKRVRELASKKRVLNLFAYTGGFSVAAALGGAAEVVTVDTSHNTLEWAKQNFALNNLDPQSFEFFATEASVFLKGCHKRNRQFDLIICDPPSLARNKSGVFRIQQDLPELVLACVSVLAKKGILLFSTNYEAWSSTEFENRVIEASDGRLSVLERGLGDIDHELPHHHPVLKSAFFG